MAEEEQDPGRLRARLRGLVAGWRPGATVTAVRPLEGGRSSLTYLVALERGAPVVVKMAPPGLPPTRNRDVLRQARVQEAVARSGRAPVAPVLFTDAGAGSSAIASSNGSNDSPPTKAMA